MKALVVDDSLINLKVAQKMLEHEGVEVQMALSGFECLEKVKTTSYDVIFMDIMMPQMDGIQTFNKLKEIKDFHTPVVTLTADVKTGAKEKYIALGFYAYIPKPININQLKEVLARIRNTQ